MSDKWFVTHEEVGRMASLVGIEIEEKHCGGRGLPSRFVKVYPIPRGGIPAAYAVKNNVLLMELVQSPEEADIFIDDIIDSGRTRNKFKEMYPDKPFYALIDKLGVKTDSWIVWPWEGTVEGSTDDIFTRLLQFLGEDASRGGLRETPSRAAKAWSEWCDGYSKDPSDVFKTFEDGAEECDGMLLVKDIPIYSHCEHHLAPFFGTVTIGYIPDGKIVGLSKLSRLADIFAHRLQVQERLTVQIANAMMQYLQPKGVGVVTHLRHLCMESRGIRKQGHITEFNALRGVLKDVPEARAEFFSRVNR